MSHKPIIINAIGLMEEAIKRNEPSFIGDAIDRVAAAYGIDSRLLGFLADASIAKARMYDGEDASIPLATSLVWLDAIRKVASK
jgi:hypothetical protein